MRNYINLIESFNVGQPTMSKSEIFRIDGAPTSLGNWVDITVEAFDLFLGNINLKEHLSMRDIDFSPLRFVFEGVEIYSIELHNNTCLVAIDAESLDNSILNNLNENVLSHISNVIKEKTGLDTVGLTDNPDVLDLFKSINLPVIV